MKNNVSSTTRIIFVLLLFTPLAFPINTYAGGGGNKKVKRYDWCFSFIDERNIGYHTGSLPSMRIIGSNLAYFISGKDPQLNWNYKDYNQKKCFRSRYKTLNIQVNDRGHINGADSLECFKRELKHRKHIVFALDNGKVYEELPSRSTVSCKLK